MACYTLGPGWGTIPMIGSHNKFHGNTIRFLKHFTRQLQPFDVFNLVKLRLKETLIVEER